jgi:hypothetical protein
VEKKALHVKTGRLGLAGLGWAVIHRHMSIRGKVEKTEKEEKSKAGSVWHVRKITHRPAGASRSILQRWRGEFIFLLFN